MMTRREMRMELNWNPSKSGPIKRYLTHIVMMGMGEPLANLNPVVKAIQVISSSDGFNLAPRRITVSTVGLVPQIEKFGKPIPAPIWRFH